MSLLRVNINDALTLLESLSKVTVQYSPFAFLGVIEKQDMVGGINTMYETVYLLGRNHPKKIILAET